MIESEDMFTLHLLLFIGSDRANHASWLLGRKALDFPVLGKQFDDVVHHFTAFIDVGILSSSEQNCHLNFVVVLQEANRFLDLKTDIVFTGFGSDANLFEPGLMRLVLGLAFFLVVIEFAKIHDTANRRLRVASNFNQIKLSFFGFFERFLSWNDA